MAPLDNRYVFNTAVAGTVNALKTSFANENNGNNKASSPFSTTLVSIFGALQSSLLSIDWSGLVKDANEGTANIENAQKKTSEKTTEALRSFQEKIAEQQKIIEENINKLTEANNRKKEIQEELEKQLEIIDKATTFLNGEQSENGESGNGSEFSSRADAIEQIKNAGVAISGLVDISSAISNIITEGQKELNDAQSSILSTKTEMDQTVSTAVNELNQQTANAASEEAKNNSNKEQGEQAIIEGEAKVQEADAASLSGLGAAAAEQLRINGEQLIEGGTNLTNSASTNLPKLAEVKGAITSDISKFTADYNSIGSLANGALTTVTARLTEFDAIGKWNDDFSSEAPKEAENIQQSAQQASTNPLIEQEAKGDLPAESNSGNNGEKIFDYDSNALKKFIAS